MGDSLDVKLARIEQAVMDGFSNTNSKLKDIIDRNTAHDIKDDKRFEDVESKMTGIDRKVVYATGVVVGILGLIKFLNQ